MRLTLLNKYTYHSTKPSNVTIEKRTSESFHMEGDGCCTEEGETPFALRPFDLVWFGIFQRAAASTTRARPWSIRLQTSPTEPLPTV